MRPKPILLGLAACAGAGCLALIADRLLHDDLDRSINDVRDLARSRALETELVVSLANLHLDLQVLRSERRRAMGKRLESLASVEKEILELVRTSLQEIQDCRPGLPALSALRKHSFFQLEPFEFVPHVDLMIEPAPSATGSQSSVQSGLSVGQAHAIHVAFYGRGDRCVAHVRNGQFHRSFEVGLWGLILEEEWFCSTGGAAPIHDVTVEFDNYVDSPIFGSSEHHRFEIFFPCSLR